MNHHRTSIESLVVRQSGVEKELATLKEVTGTMDFELASKFTNYGDLRSLEESIEKRLQGLESLMVKHDDLGVLQDELQSACQKADDNELEVQQARNEAATAAAAVKEMSEYVKAQTQQWQQRSQPASSGTREPQRYDISGDPTPQGK